MLSVRIIALAYIDLTQMQHDDRCLGWLAGCAERHWSIVHEEEGREQLEDKGWYTSGYIQVRLTRVTRRMVQRPTPDTLQAVADLADMRGKVVNRVIIGKAVPADDQLGSLAQW
jgi:hypothetical protein